MTYRAIATDNQRELTRGEMRFDLETANVDYLTHSQFILGVVETVIKRLNNQCVLSRIEIDQSAIRMKLQIPNMTEFRSYIQEHHLLRRVTQSSVANGHQAITVSISTPFKLG